MNWLAHLLLADSETDFRIAAILPDCMNLATLNTLPEQFQPKIERHRVIDSFTEKHPAFRRRVSRLDPSYRRHGEIVVDVFYDHFSTINWAQYSTFPSDDFLNTAFLSFQRYHPWLREDTRQHSGHFFTEKRLASDNEIHGICDALERIRRRFIRDLDLSTYSAHLEERHEMYRGDFEEIFAELVINPKNRAKER